MEVKAQQGEINEAPISIGLLVNKNNETEALLAARHAIQLANEKGGVKGRKLNLIIRTVEGTWGAGSSEIVELVFEDKVIGIVGSLDARNTHLAEQVIAKTQVPFLSAWASDTSLSNAYVSWFFSVVPNDEQQAEILLDNISLHKQIKEILVVFDSSYDSEQAYISLVKIAKKFPEIKINSHQIKKVSMMPELFDKTQKNNNEGIVLLGKDLPLKLIQEQMTRAKMRLPVFANIAAFGSEELLDNNGFMMFFSDSWINGDKSACEKTFVMTIEQECNIIGALTFDAVMTLVSALKLSTDGHHDLKTGLSRVHYQGITGPVKFDSMRRIKTAE